MFTLIYYITSMWKRKEEGVERGHRAQTTEAHAQHCHPPLQHAESGRLQTLGGYPYGLGQKGQDVLHPEASAQVWGFFDVKD
jgi:hypothetical protein